MPLSFKLIGGLVTGLARSELLDSLVWNRMVDGSGSCMASSATYRPMVLSATLYSSVTRMTTTMKSIEGWKNDSIRLPSTAKTMKWAAMVTPSDVIVAWLYRMIVVAKLLLLLLLIVLLLSSLTLKVLLLGVPLLDLLLSGMLLKAVANSRVVSSWRC